MLSPFETLMLSRTAYLRMQEPVFDGGSIRGRLESTEENCSLYSQLADENLVYPSRDFSTPLPGNFYSVELQPPRSREVFFAASLSDLVATHVWARHTAPSELYLADSDEICNVTSLPTQDITKNYFQTLRAVALLKKVADYEDTSTGNLKLVFLYREKLEIPVLYDVSKLRSLKKVDECLTILSDDIHREQRRTIFRTVLLESLRPLDTVDKFEKFLNTFDDLFERFNDNYQLYVAEFSFEKVLAEIAEKKLEYILKLNKTFSDIQNQLLAVPVAVVLVGSQMEVASQITVKNSIIFLGVLAFSIFMTLLIRNQFHSLKAIALEIEEQRNRIESKHMMGQQKLLEAYVELNGRERNQQRLIRTVDAVVALALLGTTGLFLWNSGLL